MTHITYSVVVAFFNEAENIEELFIRLDKVFSEIPGEVEYWFIDDGSSDQTFSILKGLYDRNPRVNVIKLSRNFGQHTALFAGLNNCRGDYCIMMDGDLQDRPENIPLLIEKIEEGYDIVVTIRRNRNEPAFRKTISNVFWWVMSTLSDTAIPPHQAFLRIFKKKVRDEVIRFREPQKFTAGIFSWVGFRQALVEVDQAKRLKGRTKYNYTKLVSQAFDAMLGFSNRPLRIISYLGAGLSCVSMVAAVGLIIKKLVTAVLPGWTSILVAIFFASGIQLFCLGMVAEYLGKLYQNTLNRPEYIVDEFLRRDGSAVSKTG